MTIWGFEVESLRSEDLVYAFRMMAGKVDREAQVNGLAYALTSEALTMSDTERSGYIIQLVNLLAETVHTAAVAQLMVEGRPTTASDADG